MLLGGAVVAAGIVDDEGATAAYQHPPRSVSPTTSRSHTRAPLPSAEPVADDGLPWQPVAGEDAPTPEPEPALSPQQTHSQAPVQDDTTTPLPVPTPDLPSTSPRVAAAAPEVDIPSPRSTSDRSTGDAGRAPADNAAPQTAIDSRPAGHDDSRAQFTFHASESASFVCSLDGSGYRPCESGIRYDDLEPGWHDFAVRATDSAGNADASPAGYRWHTSASGWAEDQVKDMLN